MDLMALAEGSERSGSCSSSKAPFLFGSQPGDRSSTSVPSAEADAIRKLEEMQLAAKPTKPKPKPKPPPAEASTAAPAPPAPPLIGVPQPEGTDLQPNEDWVCRRCAKQRKDADGDCTVPGSFRFCPTCGSSARGQLTIHEAPSPGPADDYECKGCGEFCSQSFLFCVECGNPAEAPPPPPPDECGGCGEALGESFKYCPDCGTRKGTRNLNAKAAPAADDATDWVCAVCKDDMPGSFSFCPECGARRAD